MTYELFKKKRELAKLKAQVQYGHPEKRIQKLRDAILQLTHLDTRLEAEKNTLYRFFRTELEKWSGYFADVKEIRPIAIPEDMWRARLFRGGAIACMILEAGIGGLIATTIGFPWWSGALLAALLVILFHAGFSFAFDELDEPKKTYHRIKRWLLIPSFLITLLSLLFLLFDRTVPESWVPQLLLGISMSLWSTTVGLLLFGAALLTAAHVRGWSGRFKESYDSQVALQDMTRSLHGEFAGQLALLESTSQARPASAPAEGPGEAVEGEAADSAQSAAPNGRAPVAVLLAVLFFSACTTPDVSSGVSSTATTPTASVRCRDLDIYIDHSGSCSETPFINTVRALLEQLPAIVATWDVCGTLRVIPWAQDGWNAQETLTIQLPALKVVTSQSETNQSGEVFALLPNLEKAMNEHLAAQTAEEEAQARREHQENIRQVLAPVAEQVLLPPANAPEPRCSDLNGILRRVALTTGPQPRLAVLVTDGHETCAPPIQAVPAPEGEVIAAIILVPEKPSQKKHIGYTQFETRKAELMDVAPWSIVLPYHRRDFVSLFSAARP